MLIEPEVAPARIPVEFEMSSNLISPLVFYFHCSLYSLVFSLCDANFPWSTAECFEWHLPYTLAHILTLTLFRSHT